MKKVVLNLDLHDDRIQKKAMKAVSGISRVESLSVDKSNQKFTLIGDVDPVQVVGKLRKFCHVKIVSVGPAKEEKKEEPKKEEKEKEKKPDEKEQLANLLKAYEAAYHSQMRMIQLYPYNYYCTTVEEDPNGCLIC